MRPWESVVRPAERAGHGLAGGRLLGWGQVRISGARLQGRAAIRRAARPRVRSVRGLMRTGGDTACCLGFVRHSRSGRFVQDAAGRGRLGKSGVQPALGFVRWEIQTGRAGGRRVRSCDNRAGADVLAGVGLVWALAPVRVGASVDVATKAWPRRLIVSGLLTMSSASVQRVHATLGIRGALGRAGRG